jgi:D-serine deaminase-like pyridoxal phosphate-dependent protein
MNYEQWRGVFQGARLPAAAVDLDAFDRNLDRIAQTVNRNPSLKLRIATKSIRVPELIGRALRKGRPFSGLMCYSAEEAHLLSGLGHDDFLIAYPTLQASDLTYLRSLHEAGKKISLVIDSPKSVEIVARFMAGVSRRFPLVVEADASLRMMKGRLHFGVRRSPLRSAAAVVRLARKIEDEKSVRFGGVMVYEAQLAGLTDRNPFKRLVNPAAHIIRRLSVGSVSRFRREISEALKREGLAPEIFNGGGTGSLSFAVSENVLTEVTAGSAFLCPHLFDYYSNLTLEPACFFALQVVRASDRNFATCQGGGYVASGEAGRDRLPVPYLPKGSKLIGMEGVGEVQTPIRLTNGVAVSPGDPVLFRHAKAGELAERFNEYLLISGGKIVDSVRTYRGFGHSFF